MEPANVPEIMKARGRVFNVGPPHGVAEEDVCTIQALRSVVHGGVFDGGDVWKIYVEPNELEIHTLKNGGLVELTLYADGIPPHMVSVFPVKKPLETSEEENNGTERSEDQ
jgi:hypothetical protein